MFAHDLSTLQYKARLDKTVLLLDIPSAISVGTLSANRPNPVRLGDPATEHLFVDVFGILLGNTRPTSCFGFEETIIESVSLSFGREYILCFFSSDSPWLNFARELQSRQGKLVTAQREQQEQ